MNLEASLSRSRLTATPVAVDLAHLPPFQLGPLLVEPALRRLSAPGSEARTIQPLAMRLLIVLAEAEGEPCSRDDLILACWNARIVGDDAIHRVISTLRRDLTLLSGDAVVIDTIAKVGYRLKIDGDPDPNDHQAVGISPGHVKRTFSRPAAALLAVGLLAAGLFAATRAGTHVTAIAVVADGGAANGEGARFADGLTGDLARLASTMPSLAFVEAGGQPTQEPLLLRVALDPAADLPTAHVRLVNRKGGAVIWSRDFIAESGSAAELREIVANGISGVVQCGLDRAAEFGDPVGLRLFLGACDGLTTNDMERARMFAQQITEFRPNSPAGWACLANTTIFVAGKNGTLTAAVLDEAEGYARRALAVDPTSGLAYVALGMVSRWRGESSLKILEEGIRVDPDFAMLQKHYAWALTDAGLVTAAVEPALRAAALHPHDGGYHQIAVVALLNAGRTGEALALSDRMQRRWRYDRGVHQQRLSMLFYARDPKSALAIFSASPMQARPSARITREALVWRTDPGAYDWSQFDRMAEEVLKDDPYLAWRLSANAIQMGDRARALEWLARGPPDSFTGWSTLFGPESAEVRRDPRFFAKMASIGRVAIWQKSGRWPDFCADPALGYDCRAAARSRPVG